MKTVVVLAGIEVGRSRRRRSEMKLAGGWKLGSGWGAPLPSWPCRRQGLFEEDEDRVLDRVGFVLRTG